MWKSATPASVFSVSHVWGAGVFRVRRACSGSSLGLWGAQRRQARKARFWSRKAWTLVTDVLVPHPCAVCCTKKRKRCKYQCFGHGRMNDVLIRPQTPAPRPPPPPPPPNKKTARSLQEVPKLISVFLPRAANTRVSFN